MSIVQSDNSLKEDFKERVDYNELMNCMRCGFCLPSCPTYAQTNNNEAASPRGRIALMKGVVDGLIEPDEDVENQLNLCLGCRACEPVCPSDVKYGHLLEEARDVIEQHKQRSFISKLTRNLAFKQFFPHKKRIRTVHGFLWLYQQSGLQAIAQKSKLLDFLPGNLSAMERILPTIASPKKMKARPTYVQASGSINKRVAFFSGCLMDTTFMETNDATIRLLQLAGCDIVIPESQTCCGALHAHSGEKNGAKQLAKNNIEAFENLQVDFIISNAGGCGALLVEYDHLLKDEPDWRDRAKAFASKVKDFSEVLVAMKFHDNVSLHVSDQTVTYQESCHLRNVMKASGSPRKLLQSIEGVTFKELKENYYCCGSAGIYNIVEEEMSMRILDRKMQNVKGIQPKVIISANPGCLLQMKLGIQREGLEHKIRVVHLADFLLEAVNEEALAVTEQKRKRLAHHRQA